MIITVIVVELVMLVAEVVVVAEVEIIMATVEVVVVTIVLGKPFFLIKTFLTASHKKQKKKTNTNLLYMTMSVIFPFMKRTY